MTEELNKALRIKNKHLPALLGWLRGLSLAGGESRQRTRFIEVCIPRIEEINKIRKEIVTKYAERIEGTESPKTTEDGNEYIFSDENKKTADKELEDYLNEDFVLDVMEGNHEKIKVVKRLILETKQEFSGPMAVEYDKWCEAFEKVEL